MKQSGNWNPKVSNANQASKSFIFNSIPARNLLFPWQLQSHNHWVTSEGSQNVISCNTRWNLQTIRSRSLSRSKPVHGQCNCLPVSINYSQQLAKKKTLKMLNYLSWKKWNCTCEQLQLHGTLRLSLTSQFPGKRINEKSGMKFSRSLLLVTSSCGSKLQCVAWLAAMSDNVCLSDCLLLGMTMGNHSERLNGVKSMLVDASMTQSCQIKLKRRTMWKTSVELLC